jgi:hypothetical protein
MALMQVITLDGRQIRIIWHEQAFVPPRELTTQTYGICTYRRLDSEAGLAHQLRR